MTKREKIIEIIKHGLPQEVAEIKADEILKLFANSFLDSEALPEEDLDFTEYLKTKLNQHPDNF